MRFQLRVWAANLSRSRSCKGGASRKGSHGHSYEGESCLGHIHQTGTVNEFRKLINNGKEGVNELSMQALTELVDKLNAAELEVEKAATMGIAAESKQMSEEEIVACKKVVEPAYTRKVQLCLRRQRSPP